MNVHNWGRRKSIKISVASADIILSLARPVLGKMSCLECGGQAELRTSPQYVEHADNCPGVKRYNMIANEFRPVAPNCSH